MSCTTFEADRIADRAGQITTLALRGCLQLGPRWSRQRGRWPTLPPLSVGILVIFGQQSCDDAATLKDHNANEAREDAIIRNRLRASETAILVLGGAHDLSDNVPAGVKLIVLTVKVYPGE